METGVQEMKINISEIDYEVLKYLNKQEAIGTLIISKVIKVQRGYAHRSALKLIEYGLVERKKDMKGQTKRYRWIITKNGLKFLEVFS